MDSLNSYQSNSNQTAEKFIMPEQEMIDFQQIQT